MNKFIPWPFNHQQDSFESLSEFTNFIQSRIPYGPKYFVHLLSNSALCMRALFGGGISLFGFLLK